MRLLCHFHWQHYWIMTVKRLFLMSYCHWKFQLDWTVLGFQTEMPVCNSQVYILVTWDLIVCTFSGVGLSWNLEAHVRNISGFGFPLFTSGSLLPITIWWNKENSSLWFVSFSRTLSSELLVATAIGMPCSCKCRTKRSAPEMKHKL